MLTQSISTSVIARKVGPAALPAHDQFHMIAGQAGLVATEFSYKKDEEIYGEDEPFLRDGLGLIPIKPWRGFCPNNHPFRQFRELESTRCVLIKS